MADAGQSLGVGSLISRSFRLLFANFGFLFPLAFVPATALAALNYALVGPRPAPEAPPAPAPEPAPSADAPAPGGDAAVPLDPAPLNPPPLDPADALAFGGPAEAFAIFLSVLLGFVLTGVMCLAALDAAIGKRHTVGQYLGQTLRHIGPIVVIGVVLSVATGLGILLFVIPGLYVIARYLPWAPAIVFENAGWSGLGRAQALTEGYRWPLVGATMLMGVVVLGLMLVAGPLLLAGGGSAAISILFEGVVSGFYYALIAVFTALVYLRLREIREGLGPAEIAATIG